MKRKNDSSSIQHLGTCAIFEYYSKFESKPRLSYILILTFILEFDINIELFNPIVWTIHNVYNVIHSKIYEIVVLIFFRKFLCIMPT